MRKADRSAVDAPTILIKKFSRDQKSELERAVDAFDSDALSDFEFDRYRQTSVKTALDNLFHGKCAYCESDFSATQPVDVEHYRPKKKVEKDDDHPGYWWLAANWENLLPSCIDCNRRRAQSAVRMEDLADEEAVNPNRLLDRSKKLSVGKGTAFPIAVPANRGYGPEKGRFDEAVDYIAEEEPLLIDPTREDPADNLVFYVQDAPFVLPRTTEDGVNAKGMNSILFYGLNRLGLVQARARLLRELEFMRHVFVELQVLEAEIVARLGTDEPELSDLDRSLFERICKKLGQLQSDLKSRFRELRDERSSYSAFVDAWIRSYLDM